MNTVRITIFLLLILVMTSVESFAGIWCTENVTQVITASDGNVYFTTSITCVAALCVVDPTWTDAHRNRTTSLLEGAVLSGKTIAFYWPNYSTCQQYAGTTSPAPSYVSLRNQ